MGASFENDVMDGPAPDWCDSYALSQQELQLNAMVAECHGRAVRAGWYLDPKTGAKIPRNVGEMIALIHSEASEALEAYRKNLGDEHLVGMRGIEVELADVIIRVFDLCGYLGLNLGEAYRRKLLYNARRADHSLAARAAGNGKAF